MFQFSLTLTVSSETMMFKSVFLHLAILGILKITDGSTKMYAKDKFSTKILAYKKHAGNR